MAHLLKAFLNMILHDKYAGNVMEFRDVEALEAIIAPYIEDTHLLENLL